MSEPRSFTVGGSAERREAVTCEACGERYDLVVRATASITAEAESRDDPELLAKAQAAAEANLKRLEPMESCPRCGRYQDAMVQRIFRDTAHVALKRRHDDAYLSVNAPWQRARRLRARGMDAAALGEALAPEVEAQPLLHDVLQALGAEPPTGRPGDRVDATEGEALAVLLHRLRHAAVSIEEALQGLAGLDARKAEQISERVAGDASRRDRSLGLFLAGFAVLAFGAFLAFLFAFVVPAIRKAAGAARAATASQPAAPATPAKPRRTITVRDEAAGLAATLELMESGRHRFHLVADHKGYASTFGRVLFNGAVATKGEWRSAGPDASLTIEDLGDWPGVFVEGEEHRLEVFAEVRDVMDDEIHRTESRTLQAAFTVRLPAEGEEIDDDAILAVAGEEPDRVPQAVEAAMGAGALAEIDRVLFGTPREMGAPQEAPVLSDMDRDIRRAELKERAYALAQALSRGQASADAVGMVASEDRGWFEERVRWLRSHQAEVYNAQVSEVVVDETGTNGRVRAAISVDHPEGLLAREGRATWSYRDGQWLFDPLPPVPAGSPP